MAFLYRAHPYVHKAADGFIDLALIEQTKLNRVRDSCRKRVLFQLSLAKYYVRPEPVLANVRGFKQYKKAPKGASRTTKDSLCRGVGVLEVQPAAHSKGSGLWQRAGVPAQRKNNMS